MMVESLVTALGADFYTGVPDSQLKPLCDYLYNRYGIDPEHHIIAANEGNAAALAAGYHLATGKTPVVYLQNSGLGNILNPIVSLLNRRVYGIPCLFIVGWRGEPGIHDEPQHIFQGEITRQLLEQMGIPAFVIDKNVTGEQLAAKLEEYRLSLAKGGQAAFIVRKGALTYDKQVAYGNTYSIVRETAILSIAEAAGNDIIVSTTGKISRELYETRERLGQSHDRDFLTVGSMGHCSSIALGIALQRPCRRMWCLDGDGAVLMHMGAMGLIGANRPSNFVHIVLNNQAHESVGGMPTAVWTLDFPSIARACGYQSASSVDTPGMLKQALEAAKAGNQLTFIEAKCALGSRNDLGRPVATPVENKAAFMAALMKDT